MLITVDDKSGFCPGVVSAIRKAEEQLQQHNTLYCLGDIVHNSEEVARLEKMGLITIDHAQMEQLHDTRVLLRAHGEPPSTYELAQRNNIEIIDATCPVVLQLQKKIKATYQTEEDNQIVIFGKKGHAEVNGLVGQTEGKAIVIEGPQDMSKIDYKRPVHLFSQTTMAIDSFGRLTEDISSQIEDSDNFKYQDTICRQVANRIPHLREFASQYEVILFVSGKKSSNGKALFGVCKEVNPRSYFVSHPSDVTPDMLQGVQTVGICGATSTPRWQMEQVAESIQPKCISCTFCREQPDNTLRCSCSGRNITPASEACPNLIKKS